MRVWDAFNLPTLTCLFIIIKTRRHKISDTTDPTSLVKWRKKVGVSGVEKLLSETLKTAKKEGFISKSEMKRVNVDTTVQEKAISD